MTERFCGCISIGGKLPKHLLSELVAALHEDEASHEYGEGPIEADCKDLTDYIDEAGLLTLKTDSARNGEFENTESFCCENNLGYDRWSDHYAEWDAENVYMRPNMQGPVVTYADSDGKEIVDGETVRNALALLKEYFDEDNGGNAGVRSVRDEALECLEAACPELPPPLEKFEIVE